MPYEDTKDIIPTCFIARIKGEEGGRVKGWATNFTAHSALHSLIFLYSVFRIRQEAPTHLPTPLTNANHRHNL